MKNLAPLLDPSPRALKRFVNIYRLIKARHTSCELVAFLGDEEGLSGYQCVLFLLAIDGGAPSVAPAFYEWLRAPVSQAAAPIELAAPMELARENLPVVDGAATGASGLPALMAQAARSPYLI